MKKIWYMGVVLLFVLLFTTMAQAAPTHNAIAGGYLDLDDGIFAQATLAITAQQAEPASCEASGRILAIDHAEGGRVVVEVLYMAVDGNNAWLGGVVTQSTNPNDIGDEYVWQLQDNGQGANASGPDMLGVSYMRPAEDACDMPSPFVWLNWTYGNVLVK